MKASGINPQIGAELAGALLEQKKEPQDVEKLMGELNKTFTVLEKGRVPMSQALPQMTQIMGRGISAEEAAKMFSIVALASPGAEEMAVEAALRVIEETKAKGTGKEFGVKEGMTQYESVKAFAENIDKRKQDLIAGGKTEQEATDIVNKKLAEAGVAADVRERRGLVAGFGRQGVELGRFECYEKIARETPQDFEKARTQKYEESKQGRQDKVDVAEAVAKVEAAERNERLAMWRQIAKIELTKDGASGCNQPRAELASHLAGRIRRSDNPGQSAGDPPGPGDVQRRKTNLRHRNRDKSGRHRSAPAGASQAAGIDRRAGQEGERTKDGRRRSARTATRRAPGRRRRQARILMDNSNISQIVRFLDAFVASFEFLRVGIDQTLGRDVATRIIEQINERRGGRTARHGRIVE